MHTLSPREGPAQSTLESGIVVLVGIIVLVGTFGKISKRTGGNKRTGGHFYQTLQIKKQFLHPHFLYFANNILFYTNWKQLIGYKKAFSVLLPASFHFLVYFEKNLKN